LKCLLDIANASVSSRTLLITSWRSLRRRRRFGCVRPLPGDGQPLTGIEFQSRHEDNLTLWAIYERDTTTTTPPEVIPISANPVNPIDSDLTEAMRLHRLTWST
jgi:hypothetical protein